MAWEKRGNGLYYYRKRRNGRHVVSEYLGADIGAHLIAQMDAEERREQATQRKAERHEWTQLELVETNLAKLEALTRALTGATLLASGYHQHKRQWRQQRGKD